MQFLTQNERYFLQQTCRLFAVTVRSEASVNDIIKDFKAMEMVPQMSTIIAGIESNDNSHNQRSLKLFRKYMKKFKWHMKHNILAYDKQTWDKFMNLVLADTKSNMDIVLYLFDYGAIEQMLDVVVDYLKTADFSDKALKKTDDDTLDYDENDSDGEDEIDREIVSGMQYSTDRLLGNPDLIPMLCDILRNKDKWKIEDTYKKSRFIGDVLSILQKISRFRFYKYNKQIIDGGIIEILCVHVFGDRRIYRGTAWKMIVDLLSTPDKLLVIDEILENDKLIKEMTTKPDVSTDLIVYLFGHCEREKVMNIVSMLMKNGDENLSKDTKERLLGVLNKMTDKTMYDEFMQINVSPF